MSSFPAERPFGPLLDRFVERSREILKENLAGIYLHGSAVMGCLNPDRSDLDLLTVVRDGLPDGVKKQYMEMVTGLNAEAPAKGIEMSVLRQSVCRPFIYPTPYELHFSAAHLAAYRVDPDGYVRTMKGTDRDLAAHVTVLLRRGETLYGVPAGELFGEVPGADYLDSLRYDVGNAAEEIGRAPTYMILNLARVTAYLREGAVLSKKEGGEWALAHLQDRYRGLLRTALDDYGGGPAGAYDRELASEYAQDRLREIMAPDPGRKKTEREEERTCSDH